MAREGMWGGEDRKKYPVGFGPFTKQGGGGSPRRRVWNIPMSLSPFPWTRSGRKERKKLHQQHTAGCKGKEA